MWVELSGPPPVSGTIRSNTCSEPISEKNTEMRIIGAELRQRHEAEALPGVAPSIAAAS